MFGFIGCGGPNVTVEEKLRDTMETHVKSFIRSVVVNAIMWGLILWSFFEFIL